MPAQHNTGQDRTAQSNTEHPARYHPSRLDEHGMPPALTWASEHSTNAALCISTLQRAISSASPVGPSLPPCMTGPFALWGGTQQTSALLCAGLGCDQMDPLAQQRGHFSGGATRGTLPVPLEASASKPFTDVVNSVSACGRGGRVTRVKILSGEPGQRPAASRPHQLKQHWPSLAETQRPAREVRQLPEVRDKVHGPSLSEVLLGVERGSRDLQSALCSSLRVPAPSTSPGSAFFCFLCDIFPPSVDTMETVPADEGPDGEAVLFLLAGP